MGKRKKGNGPNQSKLTTALLVKAILDILLALLHLIDRMQE